MKGTALVLLAWLACAACASVRPAGTPARDDQGTLLVYSPASVAATLGGSSLAAVREDGTAVAVASRPARREAPAGAGERLVAAGGLPEGRYAALRVTGPDAVEVDAPVSFAVGRGQAAVLSLRDGGAAPGAPRWLAVVPDRLAAGLTAVATSRAARVITLFDKLTGQVSSAIPTGHAPAGLVIDPLRRIAYVALTEEDAIAVVDLLEGTIRDRIRLSAGDGPTELALSPDGERLLASNTASNSVSVIEPGALRETARIPVGNAPGAILFDSAGTRAYVLLTLGDAIAVIDPGAAAVTATVAVEAGPLRAALSRSGERLVVVHRTSPNLLVIEAATLTVLRRVYIGPATALAVDPQTDRIYVARRGAATIDVYDPLSLLPIEMIAAGGETGFIHLDAEQNVLHLVQPRHDRLRAVRLVGRTLFEVDLAEDPYQASTMGER